MRTLLKKIYRWLPLKKELFGILRIFPVPEVIFKHLHFQGIFTIDLAGNSFKMYHYGFQLENEIFWKGLAGGWEKTSIRIWSELSVKSEYIMDIGANTGVFALISKTVNPEAKVFAFEPVMRVFEKLVRNIEVNHFDITPVRKGISNVEGTATIYDLPTDHVYSVTINENKNPPGSIVIPTTIEITTVNDYCYQNNVPRVDLLKIDVETHEPWVLEGAIDIIKKYRPSMIIEILNETVASRVSSLTKEFNYLYYELNEATGPILRSHIRPHQFTNYLICSERTAKSLKLII
jgi:FkbM family methyltransferase